MWPVAYLLAKKVNKSPKLKLRLALSEKSVSQACYRFALETARSFPHLSSQLVRQAEEENRHFLTLSKAILDDNHDEILESQQSLKLSKGLYLARHERWKPVWVPAISHDYIGKFLFNKAGFRGLPIVERLVVMALLENFNAMFYDNLARMAEGSWKDAATNISTDESWHQSYLWETAIELAPFKARLLCWKWAIKFLLVSPIALFYLYTGAKTK